MNHCFEESVSSCSYFPFFVIDDTHSSNLMSGFEALVFAGLL
jgi:hypothetical protein